MMEEICYFIGNSYLKISLKKFQQVLDQVLKVLPFARYYIDNVNLCNDTLQEHVKHLQQIFEGWGLRLHRDKCNFFHDLPHVI